MCSRLCALYLVMVACTHPRPVSPTVRAVPTPSIQVGACGDPGHDGIVSAAPRLEHADRDLDGDGQAELIVVDRAKCSDDGNCYWNVFRRSRDPGECARYAGTFAGSALETLPTRGEDNMSDVRAFWKQSGNRMLLQSYRFVRDGYRIEDVLQCKRAPDDRLDCADTNR